MDAYNEAKSEYERLINGERAADYVEKWHFFLIEELVVHLKMI